MATPNRTWPRRLLARRWLLAFVPVNAATSGFGVALPLLLLITLHGAWIDVAIAAGLFNGAVILSSMVWGYLSDRYPHRRKFLLLNYAAFAILYAASAEATSIPVIFALYAIVGLLAPAGVSASNLLILEQFSEEERPSAFASFQEMSILGSMAGLLVGYFWLLAGRPFPPLLLLMAALAAASVVAVWFGVKDAPRRFGTHHVALHPESLASRIRHTAPGRIPIPFFPTRPVFTVAAARRFGAWARREIRHEVPLIFAAGFLFNLSSNLFNISYTPYLYSLGLTASSIFLVNFANNLAQGVSFPTTGSLTSRLGADPLVQRATYIRSLGYLAVAGFTFAPLVASAAYGANLIAYTLLGGAIAFYSTASSIILFRALRGRDAGSLLGMNSALGGLAAVGGAVLSGALSVVGSFRLTFLVAAGALLLSVPLWAAAQVAYSRRPDRPGTEVVPPVDPRPAPRAETD
jgi:MFS family permease